MNLKNLQAHWDAWGELDPYWAILAAPESRGGRWDVDEFFRTGIAHAQWVLREIQGHFPDLGRGRALDFGCGAGRVTQGFADLFAEAVGVDIAPSMLRLAENQAALRGKKCRFELNSADDLRRYPDAHFDLVHSYLVLQHMRPEYSKNYIAEFIRVLKPGGVAFFQIPSEPVDAPMPVLPLLSRLASKVLPMKEPIIEMYGVPRPEVETLLAASGASTVHAEGHDVAGPDWNSALYIVRK